MSALDGAGDATDDVADALKAADLRGAPTTDAQLKGWVPSLEHSALGDFERVYEPAEDTFLLLDVLHSEREAIRGAARHRATIEVGPGSGVVAAYLAKLLGPKAHVLAADVNPDACAFAARTAAANGCCVDFMRADLARGVRSGGCGVLVFNPPYVPTPDAEVGGDGISAAWAGGLRGRRVVDRFLPRVAQLLGPGGRFYLVAVAENDPRELGRLLARDGLDMVVVGRKQARNEKLSVLRFTRPLRRETNFG